MKAEPAEGAGGFRDFRKAGKEVYRGNRNFRATEESLVKLLVRGPTAFHEHARVRPFILTDGNQMAGRFALIADERLPGTVQLSFFEAQPGLGDLLTLIRKEARQLFPGYSRLVAGLNGHLNYGAGFLLNRFDEPPLFGLPYTPAWYPSYFSRLQEKRMVTFRFPMEPIHSRYGGKALPGRIRGLTTRNMDKRNIRSEITLYTRLNNLSFTDHPYWAHRSEREDFELFHPFRHLLDDENLVFAAIDGEAAGFFLWYPDFNQLVAGQRDLGFPEWLRFRTANPADTFRFTEVGILPRFRKSHVALAMVAHALPAVAKAGYRYCEAGFIFEENKDSAAFAVRMVSRSSGIVPEPYRRFAVYEGSL